MGKRTSTAMMRIAIAGAGGFASLLAQELSRGAYAILVLSTRVNRPWATTLLRLANWLLGTPRI